MWKPNSRTVPAEARTPGRIPLAAGLTILSVLTLAGCNGNGSSASANNMSSGGSITTSGSTTGGSTSNSSTTNGGSTTNSSSTTGGSSGAGSNTVTNGALAAPANVQIILQGQDSQEQSHSGVPQQPNHVTIGWHSVSGATSYNVYRSVNQGSYSLYATVSASAAGSAYSSYVANSGTCDLGGVVDLCPYQTSVDSAYQDTNATQAVGPRRARRTARTRGLISTPAMATRTR